MGVFPTDPRVRRTGGDVEEETICGDGDRADDLKRRNSHEAEIPIGSEGRVRGEVGIELSSPTEERRKSES